MRACRRSGDRGRTPADKGREREPRELRVAAKSVGVADSGGAPAARQKGQCWDAEPATPLAGSWSLRVPPVDEQMSNKLGAPASRCTMCQLLMPPANNCAHKASKPNQAVRRVRWRSVRSRDDMGAF